MKNSPDLLRATMTSSTLAKGSNYILLGSYKRITVKGSMNTYRNGSYKVKDHLDFYAGSPKLGS